MSRKDKADRRINRSLPVTEKEPGRWKLSWLAGVLILFSFVVRLYAFYHMPVINPDGTMYIQQARAISYGLRHSITSCYQVLSNYPFFITFSHLLFGDWVTAARAVSLFFGTLMLVPCYLLLRRFFDETISCLCLLLLALNPTFVAVSADAMRDPVYWFFTAAGLYLFILQSKERNDLYCVLASLSFVMCGWARVEGVLFVLVSTLFLLWKKQRDRWRRLFFFLLPIACLSSLAIVCLMGFHYDPRGGFGLEKIGARLYGIIESYQSLRIKLSHLIEENPSGFSPYFLPKVRNLIWLIALGAVCVQIVRAFFPPFFLPFVLGLPGSKNRILKDSRLMYLSALSVFSLGLLYLQIIYNWAMVSRFIAVFILPSLVFIGLGFERILTYFNEKLKWKRNVGLALLCSLILFIGIPKNLETHREDKMVLREVGEFIAAQEGNDSEVLVAGAFKRLIMVHFYANLGYLGAPCMREDSRLDSRDPRSVGRLMEKGFDYFIWDEKSWATDDLEYARKEYQGQMTQVGEWQSPYLGKVVLFKIKK